MLMTTPLLALAASASFALPASAAKRPEGEAKGITNSRSGLNSTRLEKRDQKYGVEAYLDRQDDLARGGIDWGRHGGKSYLRFVLAASVYQPLETRKPIIIGVPKCAEGDKAPTDWAADEDALVKTLNEDSKALVTMNLTDKVDVDYKKCSTFVAHDSAPEDYEPGKNKACSGWPIAVTISSDRQKTVGWNVSTARVDEVKRIQWVEDVGKNRLRDNLVVDCTWWWYEHEASGVWHRPQYYGQHCRLRIRNDEGKSLCITAAGRDLVEMSNYKPLSYEECRQDLKSRQVWHLQSSALEWPDYYEDG